MVSSTRKSIPENTPFVEPLATPYLVKTDAAGQVLSVCKKFAGLLSDFSIAVPSSVNIADIFTQLGGVSPFSAEDLIHHGYPPVFDSLLQGSGNWTFSIRWMAVPLSGQDSRSAEWQLTGVMAQDLPAFPKMEINSDRLRREKDLADEIINSLPGVFYLFDQEGKFLRWNKQLEKVSGYNSSEIAKMRPVDFVSDKEKPYITSRIHKAFDEGASDAESKMLTRYGVEIPFYYTAQHIIYESKSCLIGMGIEISEIKKAEQHIRISNERYKLATRATNDVIWDWDVQEATPFWGEGFFSQFGYQEAEKINARGFWESNIHPADQERVLTSRENFIRKKQDGLWSEEYRFRKANGEYAIVSDRGFLVFGEEGSVIRVVGSMQDITERKKLENKLLQQEINKQKLVAKTMIEAQENERAAIGKELHDNVNQILSTSKLYLELFRSEPHDVKLLDLCLENIMNAIHEIRNISRALVPSTIGDLGLLESVNELVESIRQTKSFQVEFHTEAWDEEIFTNHQKLTLFRIIQEQVNNVIRHAEARNLSIELSMDPTEDQVNLRMSDDGKGFDPEKTKKGLGLSNIMSRADHFGGKAVIESAPGSGCILLVQIPIHHLSKNDP